MATDTLTLVKRLRTMLEARKWADNAGNEFVFGQKGSGMASAGVRVSMWPADQALAYMRTPCALIRPFGASADPQWDQEPGFLIQTVGVTIIVAVTGDEIGENALIGGPRTAGAVSSKGRGLLEIEAEVLDEIERVNQAESVNLYCRTKSAPTPILVEELGYVIYRDYEFECAVTS